MEGNSEMLASSSRQVFFCDWKWAKKYVLERHLAWDYPLYAFFSNLFSLIGSKETWVRDVIVSIVELKTNWEKETCIYVELGNFIFFSIWFEIVLSIKWVFVFNEKYNFSFNYL